MAATKKKRVGKLRVPIPEQAQIFTTKSQLNTVPTPAIVVYTLEMHVRDVLYDCTHLYVRDVTS